VANVGMARAGRNEDGDAQIPASTANVFSSLFGWRPSENKSSSENFLTEAFVYCLRANEKLCRTWLTKILGQDVDCSGIEITTRASYVDQENATTIYPDIDARGTFENGKPFNLLIEVKWGAPYDRSQVQKYDRLLKGQENPYLIFISPNAMDCLKAAQDAGSLQSRFQAIRWDQVHSHLTAYSQHCRITRELGDFMDQQGLSAPKPISSTLIDEYLAGRDLLRRLWRYAEKLHHEFKWDFLPEIYHSPDHQSVRDQFGRIGIVFTPNGWDGAISVGFLYSNHDHKVRFADGSNASVDLMMRIESAPKAAGREEVISALREVAPKVKTAGGAVHLAGDHGNKNRHTLFIAQMSLRDFVQGNGESEQLRLMHEQIHTWSDALFRDGRLAEALSHLAR